MQNSAERTPISVPTELMAGVEKIDIYRNEFVEYRLEGLNDDELRSHAANFEYRIVSNNSKTKWESAPAQLLQGEKGRILCLTMHRRVKRFGKPIPPMFDTIKPKMLVSQYEGLELSYLLNEHTHSTIVHRFKELLLQEADKADGWRAVGSGTTVNSKAAHLVLTLQRQIN